MAGITVNSISISELLDSLRGREWLAPKFQREFIWTIEQIKLLINSIINGHPIGMVTLWAQPDVGALELEPLSLPDNNEDQCKSYCLSNIDAKKKYAILDGRQRSTSIAMAFGGFRADDSSYKYSGRFFLNVKYGNETERIEYFKDNDLKKKGIETEAAQISEGYFPLFTNENKNLNNQWMDYIAAIRNPKFYKNNRLPEEDDLIFREEVLRKAFNGIIDTKIAVYIVPEKFNLGEICEIFETLNTTGTKVSTVDLIHSWLFSDTFSDPEGQIMLREWIQEMSERDGTLGWADPERRPELMAQISTACYVAQESKALPRTVGGRTGKTPIISIKAGDLLATPKEHWRQIINNADYLSGYLADFQDLVANGRFPWMRCPYPISAAIYIALRWHKHRDNVNTWSNDDLDALYRAFFWKNALAGRYDQGFLTQLGVDIKTLKEILSTRKNYKTANEWVIYATKELDRLINHNAPNKEALVKLLCEGRPGGAIQKAIQLLLYTKPRKDLIDQEIDLNYPLNTTAELHHIFPKTWYRKNKTVELKKIIGKEDMINSTANMMLLSRESNNYWKDRKPENVIEDNKFDFNNMKNIFTDLFIDFTAFEYLKMGIENIRRFWERRAEIIATELEGRMKIQL